LSSSKINRDELQIPNNLKLADTEFCKNDPIDILIGAEFFLELIETGKIELKGNQLILQNIKFGWVVAESVALGSLISE